MPPEWSKWQWVRTTERGLFCIGKISKKIVVVASADVVAAGASKVVLLLKSFILLLKVLVLLRPLNSYSCSWFAAA